MLVISSPLIFNTRGTEYGQEKTKDVQGEMGVCKVQSSNFTVTLSAVSWKKSILLCVSKNEAEKK